MFLFKILKYLWKHVWICFKMFQPKIRNVFNAAKINLAKCWWLLKLGIYILKISGRVQKHIFFEGDETATDDIFMVGKEKNCKLCLVLQSLSSTHVAPPLVGSETVLHHGLPFNSFFFF